MKKFAPSNFLSLLMVLAFSAHADAQDERLVESITTDDFVWVNATEPATSRPVGKFEAPLPDSATLRFGTTRYRQSRPSTVSFLSDNTTLLEWRAELSATPIAFRNSKTGQITSRIVFGSPQLRAVGAGTSANGHFAVLCATLFDPDTKDYRAYCKIWDIRTREAVAACSWDADRFSLENSVPEISGDGTRVAILSRFGKVFLWHTNEPKPRLITLPEQRINQIYLNRDATEIVVLSRDGLFAWDLSTESKRLSIEGFKATDTMAISPTEKHVAVIDRNADAIYVYDLSSGRRLHSLRMPGPRGVDYRRSALVFLPGSDTLYISSQTRRAIAAFDCALGTSEGHWAIETPPLRSIAFSPNGKLLAGNTGHTLLKVWQVEDMAELSATPPGHTGVVEAIAFTEGGEQLLTAGASRELAAWHTNAAEHRYIKRAPPALERVGTITDIALSPDQQHAISLGFQVGLDCWNVTAGELRFHLPRHGQTGTYGSHAVAFSADGKRFYSFGPEYYLRVWDFRTGKALEEYRPFPPDAELIKRDGEVAVSDPFGMAGAAGVPPISVSEFSEDGSTLAFLADKIYFVDTSTGNVIRTFDSIATAHGIFSKSLEQFAFGEGATFSICKLSDQGKVASIDVDAARSARPICYSPDSRLLAVLCFPLARETSEPWITIYDSASHEPLYRVEGVPLGHGRMAFTGDNRHIAVGQLDATILMFELAPFRVPSE